MGEASARYLTKSSIGPECPGRQSCNTAPADAAEKIAFRICGLFEMAAGPVIEVRRDDEALFRPRPCGDGTHKQRHCLAQCRLRRQRAPEDRSMKVARGSLDEAPHFADPRRVEH